MAALREVFKWQRAQTRREAQRRAVDKEWWSRHLRACFEEALTAERDAQVSSGPMRRVHERSDAWTWSDDYASVYDFYHYVTRLPWDGRRKSGPYEAVIVSFQHSKPFGRPDQWKPRVQFVMKEEARLIPPMPRYDKDYELGGVALTTYSSIRTACERLAQVMKKLVDAPTPEAAAAAERAVAAERAEPKALGTTGRKLSTPQRVFDEGHAAARWVEANTDEADGRQVTLRKAVRKSAAHLKPGTLQPKNNRLSCVQRAVAIAWRKDDRAGGGTAAWRSLVRALGFTPSGRDLATSPKWGKAMFPERA